MLTLTEDVGAPARAQERAPERVTNMRRVGGVSQAKRSVRRKAQQLVLSPWFPMAYRLTLAVVLTAAIAPPAYAAGDPIITLGTQVLGVILSLVGAFAAVCGAAVGLRLVVGSGTGSSYAMSQAVFALIGVVAGVALAMFGPYIAKAVMTAAQTGGATKDIPVPFG